MVFKTIKNQLNKARIVEYLAIKIYNLIPNFNDHLNFYEQA